MRQTIRKLATLFMALVLCQTTALPWSDTGHMVVARIAQENLSQPVRTRVTQLTVKVRLATTTYDFVTVACWMDDIRDFPMFEPIKLWHYIDRRFIVSGPAQDAPPPPMNVQSILEWCIETLGSPRARDMVKAYALAKLVHLSGDVHQPLHGATRYTTAHPDGDAGGNLFKLSNAPRDNLHAYWDAAGGLFNFTEVPRPLNNSGRQKLRQLALDFMAAHPASSLPNVDDLRPATWVDESHQLARSECYQNIEEKGTPSATYAANTQAVCKKRIALAGYRLAKVLEKAFLPQ